MLKLDFMPARTKRVFDALATEPLMQGFVLIGGTALSIQLGHRLSEDLDFWWPSATMSKDRVNRILENLAAAGFHHEFATPAWKISQARINGIDLLSQSRDHVIEGVKVTFFARDDVPYRHFAAMKKIQGDFQFAIAHEETIFNMKAWLISQRVRSRDLFDLMAMLQRGKTIRDILDAGAQADPAFQREYAKDVLVGNVPLDADDEGFDSIGLSVTLNDIQQYFLAAVNKFEIDLAKTEVQKHRSGLAQ